MNAACYGNPIALSASAACRGCPQAAGCVVHAREALDLLPHIPDVIRARQALGSTQAALFPASLPTLPARVSGPVAVLSRKGWFRFAQAELAAGRNPAPAGWKRVLCQALLTGTISRGALQLAFERQLGLAPDSARVQLATGLAIFAAGGLARVDDDRVSVSSN